MRVQCDATAEYGLLEPLVESWPVNFPAEYGFRLPNAVDWRSIHHHYTGLGKAHTSCETVHDFWVRARVERDTFLSIICLAINTVYRAKRNQKKNISRQETSIFEVIFWCLPLYSIIMLHSLFLLLCKVCWFYIVRSLLFAQSTFRHIWEIVFKKSMHFCTRISKKM